MRARGSGVCRHRGGACRRGNAAVFGQLVDPVCVSRRDRHFDFAQSRLQLLFGRDLLHHQGAFGGAAAGCHHGLFHLFVAQLRRTQAALRRPRGGDGACHQGDLCLGHRQLRHHRGRLYRALLYDLYARTRPRHRHGKGRAAGCARLRDRAACHDSGARQAARQDHAPVADSAGKKARVGRGQNFSRLFDTLCRAGGACLLRLQQDQRRGLLRPVAQSAGGYAQRDCQQQAGKGVCHGQHPHGAGQRQAAVRRRAAYAGGI